MDKDIVNTPVRKDFILKDLHTLIKDFEKETKIGCSGIGDALYTNNEHSKYY